MKWEWRKDEKKLYFPKEEPELIEVPKCKYFCIKGKGNPNEQEFADKVGVLYGVSYAVKMMSKKEIVPPGYFEYTVYPLEGLWDLTEKGRQQETWNKEELLYTIMIRQPDFVTMEVFENALKIVQKKKPSSFLKEVFFEEVEDGLSVQMIHSGSYDTEKESFDQMKQYICQHQLKLETLVHREIYLSDVRKGEKQQKTVLRYRVSK